jgi:hypothetical protein
LELFLGRLFMPTQSIGLRKKVVLGIIEAGCVVVLSSLGVSGAETKPPVQFSRDQVELYEKQIQPVLAENCYKCHSHQADKIKGGFVLDSREALLKGGDTGPAIVPGEPEKSLLIKAVRHVDEDLQMPPKKKLPEEQIALLIKWVSMGAPYSDKAFSQTGPAKTRKITAEDRSWWAFQPVKKLEIPAGNDAGWSRNAVDKFIFARLQGAGLKPAPEANRSTLIRRVYFDVIGLPPTAEEVERFIADQSPDAYEKVVDRLLQKPAYGEKWARHWLDLVRFAESDGFKSDSFRPNAWRYRDYVIRSFNEDKPYNRFLMEQVAADELWPDDPDTLIGVSYLRLWIYEYNQRNVKEQWAGILNDITDVTGDAFMGLGMQCARCHDHKFDPILQKDYFRLQSYFAAILPLQDAALATPEAIRTYQAQQRIWEEKTAGIRGETDGLERSAREKSKKAVIEKLPKEIQAIMHKPAGELTPYEQQIYDLAYRQVTEEDDKLDGKYKNQDKIDALKKELAAYDGIKPKALPSALLVKDVGPIAPPVIIPKDKSQTPIEPGLLTLLEEAPAKIEAPARPGSTGRRSALAKWLADPRNPLTTRVVVNRIWQRHFGRGLVGTSSDFGHLGELPSNPELLDWLASYFVDHQWSVKQMHRLILTSAAYRQNATVAEESQVAGGKTGVVDPDNRLLWRQNLRRLESDQIRDAMLWASGELDTKNSGPSVDTSKPRRTIYTKWLRNSRDPLLEAFDPPDPYASVAQRNTTTTPMQSLVMINGPYVLQRAQELAGRIQKQGAKTEEEQVVAAYRLACSRNPSAEEKARGATFLVEQGKRIAQSREKPALVTVGTFPGRMGTAADFKAAGGQTRLQVPDNHLMPQYDFTIEAFVMLRSSEGVGARTIVSRWDGRKDQPGWSLVAEGTTNSLALELVGDAAEDGTGGYELVSSKLRVEMNTPYYVAAVVRLGDTNETGVTFYVKETSPGGTLQTAHRPHHVTANHQSNLPLIIGGRDPEKHLTCDGLIDDVRLSSQALKAEDLLLNRDATSDSTVGYWRFEEPDLLKDSSPNGHNIRPEVSPAAHLDARTAALVDFCHVLLNSNEFLYVD